MNAVDDLLRQHRELQSAMQRAWNAFFASFGSLRPVQLAAMPVVLSGTNTLVTAPTAGGKTEATAAPICERLLRERWPGLSVLLITPTRALVNDLYARLERPLSELRIGLGRKTSDHAEWDDPQCQFVVTTPESTESLLTFHRESLVNVRAVILDEIHLLAGTPRGDQLQLVLRRLTRFLQHRAGDQFAGCQRVAMSATVADPSELAGRFLGPAFQIVSVPGQRSIDARIVVAGDNETARIAAAMSEVENMPDVRKILVFVNSRRFVDEGVACFQTGRFRRAPVFGHHGSLLKLSREETEHRFRDAECAICVATMTLEVGIDIGDIDLVVCLDPPFSLASFLQRIGRGCRRRKGATRVVCVARRRADELIFQALIRQASAGMPRGPRSPLRRSVAFQQVLAYLRQVDKHRRTGNQFRQCFLGDDMSPLNETGLNGLLSEMTVTGWLDRESDVYRPTTQGWDFIGSSRIFSNIAPTPTSTEVVDADTGESIATVAVVERAPGAVNIAGKSYELLPGGTSSRQLVRRTEKSGGSPRYHAASLPYSFDIGASLANLLMEQPGRLLCLSIGDSVNVFTWLGKLLNVALEMGLRRLGISAVPGDFHLRTTIRDIATIPKLLRRAVDELSRNNPLGDVNLANIVDLGPHFEFLSPETQGLSQRDWLDTDFLQAWAAKLMDCQSVPSDVEIGHDLMAFLMR